MAAVTEDAAWEAAYKVKVEYEPLPTISSIEEALATPEPRIHDYGDQGNLHKVVSMTFGDVDGGFAAADEIFEDTVFYEGNTHLPMEQHAAVAVPEDDDRVTLYSSTQTPHYVHRALTKVLELPASRVRVVACSNGGGFGGKSDPFNHEIVAAKMALKLGRPVKVTLTREEVFYCHRGRHPVLMRRAHRHQEGQGRPRPITAQHLQTALDGGAYGSYGVASTYYTGRAPDRHLRDAGLPLRRRARLHQQAAVRPQARPRHAAAALRLRDPPRQDRGEDSASTPPTCASACSPSRTRSPPTGCASAPWACGSASRRWSRAAASASAGASSPRAAASGLACGSYLCGAGPADLLEPHAAVRA